MYFTFYTLKNLILSMLIYADKDFIFHIEHWAWLKNKK